jgi:hypothetical protein
MVFARPSHPYTVKLHEASHLNPAELKAAGEPGMIPEAKACPIPDA